jgi:hypothetical protein
LVKRSLPTIQLLLILLLAVPCGAASRLSGTWQLDKTKGELPGGRATLDSTLTVDVDGDVVTARRTGVVGMAFTLDRYELDGQPHAYPFGDTVPAQTRIRTASWLSKADGFKVVDGGATAVWTVSSDGQFLTVETTVERPCPPCSPPNPKVDHTVYVFSRVP